MQRPLNRDRAAVRHAGCAVQHLRMHMCIVFVHARAQEAGSERVGVGVAVVVVVVAVVVGEVVLIGRLREPQGRTPCVS